MGAESDTVEGAEGLDNDSDAADTALAAVWSDDSAWAASDDAASCACDTEEDTASDGGCDNVSDCVSAGAGVLDDFSFENGHKLRFALPLCSI